MDMWFRPTWLCVFQHNLSELFSSDLCQLVLAETVSPGSDQPCHQMPPTLSDKKVFDKCWNCFPSMSPRPRMEEGKKKTDRNTKLAAIYDSHQDGKERHWLRHVSGSLALFVFEKVLVSLTDEEILLNVEKMKITAVKIEKNNEGHAVKTNYIKIDITFQKNVKPHLPKTHDCSYTMSCLHFTGINKRLIPLFYILVIKTN